MDGSGGVCPVIVGPGSGNKGSREISVPRECSVKNRCPLYPAFLEYLLVSGRPPSTSDACTRQVDYMSYVFREDSLVKFVFEGVPLVVSDPGLKGRIPSQVQHLVPAFLKKRSKVSAYKAGCPGNENFLHNGNVFTKVITQVQTDQPKHCDRVSSLLFPRTRERNPRRHGARLSGREHIAPHIFYYE